MVPKVGISTYQPTSSTRTYCASLLKQLPRLNIGWYHVNMSYARSIHDKSFQGSQKWSNHDMTGPNWVKPMCWSMTIKPETVFANQKWSLPKDHFRNGLRLPGYMYKLLSYWIDLNQIALSITPFPRLACWIQAGEMQWYRPGANAVAAEA